MTYDYLETVKDDFRDFIRLSRDDVSAAYPVEFTHLQDYVAHWLESGSAIRLTGNNFGTYMRVVVRIIDAWNKDPTLNGAIEHPVQGIMAPEGSGAVFIDPEYFGSIATRQLLGLGNVDQYAMPGSAGPWRPLPHD
jgi:hypothetical protein